MALQTGIEPSQPCPDHSRLDQASFLFLAIPFILFVVGWLSIQVGLVIVLIFGWIIWRNRSLRIFLIQKISLPDRGWFLGALVLGIWAVLSGIGGYAYQNPDFHIRNAIFHDLIQYPWPVVYPAGTGNAGYALVYYIGFWLPAALVGKVAGESAANVALYLWAATGVLLVAVQIRRYLRTPLSAAALLLMFFSGMDALGRILLNGLIFHVFPSFWPPTLHLEWWLPVLQYSSFTTQLFWVFNQALPAWLCIMLILKGTEKRLLLLTWSLCFFYSPIPALGLAPLVVYEIIRDNFLPSAWLKGMKRFSAVVQAAWKSLLACCSVENILGGGSVMAVSMAYFAANQTSSRFAIHIPQPLLLLLYLLFFLMEGGWLWLLLLPWHRKDPRFYLAGAMLLLFPYISIGYGSDFAMRATIPALFCLMIWSGKSLLRKRTLFTGAIITCLIIGSITPLYEINRSIYWTVRAYRAEIIGSAEEGLNSLSANRQKTLSDAGLLTYFLADPAKSVFFQRLVRR